METRNILLAAVAMFAAAGIQSTASATLLAYEPFSQTAGNGSGIEGSTTSDTFGFTGNWVNVGDGNTTSILNANLSSPYARPSIDNEVQFDETTSSDFDTEQRTLTTAVQSSLPSDASPSDYGSMFVSFLIQLSSVGSSTSPTAILKLFNNTASTQILAVGYNPPNFGSNAATDWGLKIGSTGISTTVAATTGTTLLVAELDYNGAGDDSIEYYIGNSNLGSLTEVYQSGDNLTLADPVGMVQLSTEDNGGASATPIFDEIRVGQTLADVVPEPASLGMLASIGAAAMLRRRRRGAV